MGQVNGTFINDGQPRDGATAKLWQAAGFASPPIFDEAEPAGGYQVGSSITTGTTYGGNGAYRFTSVAEGDYYVSCYYNAHRVWQYYHVESIDDILTTQGDLLVRGASAPERKAKGSDGQIWMMVSGSPAWADLTLTVTENLAPITSWSQCSTSAYVTKWSQTIAAAAKKIIAIISAAACGYANVVCLRVLYNGVEKAAVSGDAQSAGQICKWYGDGIGSDATLALQEYSTSAYFELFQGSIFSVS